MMAEGVTVINQDELKIFQRMKATPAIFKVLWRMPSAMFCNGYLS
jgi:hypothetical protein